jgi:primosomal protein N' (replication factor Y)
MRYAKVVLPLPVEGPFDYIIPPELIGKVGLGSRVLVSFGSKNALGFVVGLSRTSAISRLKNISQVLDEPPAISRALLALTKKVSDYYCASWGEVIAAALPDALRRPAPFSFLRPPEADIQGAQGKIILIHSLSKAQRWQKYLEFIQEALSSGESVIILLPDAHYAKKTAEMIKEELGISPAEFIKKGKSQLEEWRRVKQGEIGVVVGTRSAVFAPLVKPGLIIVEEEQDSVYKQEQVPHYHSRQVAFLRSALEGARVVLGTFSPSLECFHLAQKGKIEYSLIGRDEPGVEVKIVDMKGLRQINKKIIFSKYLEDAVFSVLAASGKVLLFLNRRGFATFAQCPVCGKVLACPRCNISLVYHFERKELACHHCNYREPKPDICPHCRSGYIRYSGLGTEKIESEISRIFPAARIKRLDTPEFNIEEADIFISTSSIIKECNCQFDLVGVLAIDNSLHRIDFRSAEKTFSLLLGILGLTKRKMIIQTSLPSHHIFLAIEKKDWGLFYSAELKQRKSLGLPPFKHLGMVKLRSTLKEKAWQSAAKVYERLKGIPSSGIKVFSLSPGQPEKLRGYYYYQILIKANSALAISKFLARNLKKPGHTNTIMTVDINPL